MYVAIEDPEVKMPAAVAKYFFLMLLFVGIVFYVAWVIADPTTWNDVGVYSVTAMFVGFGLVGYWHYSNLEKDEESNEIPR